MVMSSVDDLASFGRATQPSRRTSTMPTVQTSTPANSPEPIGPYNHIARVGTFITIQDAVNAASNEISSFAVQPNGLTLASKVASGGATPISLSVYKNVLYVLNAGDPGNITGFSVGKHGELSSRPGAATASRAFRCCIL